MTRTDGSPNWGQLRTLAGTAEVVPDAVQRMVHAESANAAYETYWELDNHVVVQGQLFESAPETAVLVANEICAGSVTEFGLGRAFDLLVEIASGESDHTEVDLGNADLGDRSRQALRPFVPCFRAMASDTDGRALLGILDLLDVLETDREKLRLIARAVLARGIDPAVGKRARELSDGQ